MTEKKEQPKTDSRHKTIFNEQRARQFLLDFYGIGYPELVTLKGGESSQAFRFKTSEGLHVLRINRHTSSGFGKDKLAATEFVSPKVPIPVLLHVGKTQTGEFFAVSKAALGVTLNTLPLDQRLQMLPKMAGVLNAIHETAPLGEGFGEWEPDCKGTFGSWRESILSGLNPKTDSNKPHFYDDYLHSKIRNEIERLLEMCPEERRLIHGDFGMDNVLVYNGEVSGVIDWEQSAYGDPLYDIARLDFWDTEAGYRQWFREYYARQPDSELGRNFEERIACYQLVTAIGAMDFYAETDQPGKYEFTKNRALQLLAVE